MPTPLPARVAPLQLARTGARLAGVVEPERLPRVAGLETDGASGGVAVDLVFELDSRGRATVVGAVDGRIGVECQRCLERLVLDVHADVALVLVDDDDPRSAPAGLEPLEGAADGLDVCALVEDELLLAMPTVAMHEEGACEPPGGAQAAGDEHTVRPFAGLRGLMDDDQGG